jgi:hypothetical protein
MLRRGRVVFLQRAGKRFGRDVHSLRYVVLTKWAPRRRDNSRITYSVSLRLAKRQGHSSPVVEFTALVFLVLPELYRTRRRPREPNMEAPFLGEGRMLLRVAWIAPLVSAKLLVGPQQ